MACLTRLCRGPHAKTPEPVPEGEEKPAMTPAQLKARIERLIEKSCYTVFAWVAQGLFERHKLIFGSQLCFRVLARRGELDGKCAYCARPDRPNQRFMLTCACLG